MTEKISATQRLVESALLIAMGVVLSLIKIIDLPYGGSVTIASMFPVMLIAYRHGLGFGLVSATVFGGIQQLLGLKTLSWVSTWQSVLAVILLDYIVAFAVIGLGGLFRGRFGKRTDGQVYELLAGALLVCLLRYICHVIS
ncbi:MAG: energy-coupled thiamine transporter ThiT, partial [Clostridia bacterium]|nr:energy-coupled thiamine transporter ThiT [Clostridia bacterium]